jgi:hypothetical protein
LDVVLTVVGSQPSASTATVGKISASDSPGPGVENRTAEHFSEQNLEGRDDDRYSMPHSSQMRVLITTKGYSLCVMIILVSNDVQLVN